MKRVIQHRIDNAWQKSWDLQTNDKLHCVKPVIGSLPVMPMRRTDVKLTRLRIGHTRFTHRHLLLDENAPECPSLPPVWRSQIEAHKIHRGKRLEGLEKVNILTTIFYDRLCITVGSSGPRKAISQETRCPMTLLNTDREDRRIQRVVVEHCSAFAAEIIAFVTPE
ncbi:RNase H domain-containing protein [Trichonephila clavipes]|nr:RNase H domain-containing protein [Trichonephila clavipes]